MWAAGESRHSRKVPDRRLDALQGGDHTATRLHQLVRFDPEHVVPRARRSPDLFELEQVRVDEDPKLRAVAKGRNASGWTRAYADVALSWKRTPQLSGRTDCREASQRPGFVALHDVPARHGRKIGAVIKTSATYVAMNMSRPTTRQGPASTPSSSTTIPTGRTSARRPNNTRIQGVQVFL